MLIVFAGQINSVVVVGLSFQMNKLGDLSIDHLKNRYRNPEEGHFMHSILIFHVLKFWSGYFID